MQQQHEEYSEWLTQESQHCNIFSALSHNLRRYENIYRNGENKEGRNGNGREKHQVQVRKTIEHHEENDKENQRRYGMNQRPQQHKYKNWLEEIDGKDLQTPNPLPRKEEKDFKIRVTSRNSKSSHENRQDYKALKTKEFKFQKKDKKKFKDRCVQLYGQARTKNRISLKQIDNINKQSKQQKIDLFLKLLRR